MARAALMLVGLLVGCGVAGNGQLQSEERELTGFTRVRSEGPFQVTVRDQLEQRVVVTGDSNLLSYASTRLEGDTLVIKGPDGFWLSDGSEVRVDVSLPAVRALDNDGSGSLSAELTTAALDLDVSHAGSGAVRVSGDFGSLTTVSPGAGTGTYVGKASTWTARASGTGLVDGRQLTAEDAVLSLSGVGALKATVQRTLRASVSGLGSIEWWGPAQVVVVDDTGPGEILHR